MSATVMGTCRGDVLSPLTRVLAELERRIGAKPHRMALYELNELQTFVLCMIGEEDAAAEPGQRTAVARVEVPFEIRCQPRYMAPADLEPTGQQMLLATELEVDVATELRYFKAFQFKRKINDWELAFTKWLRRTHG